LVSYTLDQHLKSELVKYRISKRKTFDIMTSFINKQLSMPQQSSSSNIKLIDLESTCNFDDFKTILTKADKPFDLIIILNRYRNQCMLYSSQNKTKFIDYQQKITQIGGENQLKFISISNSFGYFQLNNSIFDQIKSIFILKD
jgi:hypothetical protein